MLYCMSQFNCILWYGSGMSHSKRMDRIDKSQNVSILVYNLVCVPAAFFLHGKFFMTYLVDNIFCNNSFFLFTDLFFLVTEREFERER